MLSAILNQTTRKDVIKIIYYLGFIINQYSLMSNKKILMYLRWSYLSLKSRRKKNVMIDR